MSVNRLNDIKAMIFDILYCFFLTSSRFIEKQKKICTQCADFFHYLKYYMILEINSIIHNFLL